MFVCLRWLGSLSKQDFLVGEIETKIMIIIFFFYQRRQASKKKWLQALYLVSHESIKCERIGAGVALVACFARRLHNFFCG